MADTSDLYTQVKNTSGAARFYGYIRRHGTKLAANATVTIFGGVSSQPGWNDRKQASFEADLLSGAITILKTPKTIQADTAPATALTNPSTTATVNVTGGGASGGALAAGHYRVAYTFYNKWGQTLAGGISADFNVGATNIPRVTLPAIPGGATGIKVYLSNVSVGATASSVALAYFDKITTGTTLDLNSASWNEGGSVFASAPTVPTANTTAGHVPRVLSTSNDVVGTTDPSWVTTAIAGAGVQGSQGTTGAQGSQGSQGAQGAQGAAGS